MCFIEALVARKEMLLEGQSTMFLSVVSYLNLDPISQFGYCNLINWLKCTCFVMYLLCACLISTLIYSLSQRVTRGSRSIALLSEVSVTGRART